MNANKSLQLVNAGVSLLIGVAVLFFARDLIAHFAATGKKAAPREQSVPVTKRPAFQDYAQLVVKNPFGAQAGELRSLSGAKAAAAPVTSVTVRGTVAGRGKFGYAFMTDKSGRQEVFRVGDNVFGVGVLKRVEKDRVIIQSGGADTVVPFSDLSAMEKTTAATQAAPQLTQQRPADGVSVIDHARLQESLDNPRQIMTDARFLPNMVDGSQQGFVLREVRAGGIYQNLGLQNGDVVLRINEFAVSNPETALQAINALRGMDRINLDIIRNGARTTLSYIIR